MKTREQADELYSTVHQHSDETYIVEHSILYTPDQDWCVMVLVEDFRLNQKAYLLPNELSYRRLKAALETLRKLEL